MIELGRLRRKRRLELVEGSPLRRVDARGKLALALCASLAVMLPLPRLALFMGLYVLLLGWARLLPEAARQVWRLKWVLGLLFMLDAWLIGIDLAVVITLRLVLLAGAFTLFFATTSPRELRQVLEWLRLPHRYAFSLTLAFQSLALLDEEWRAIHEAQQSRGAWTATSGWRRPWAQVRDAVALSVPVIVLTTRRAWAITEAAYARGFGSPRHRPFRRLQASRFDWLLLAASVVTAAALLFLR